MSDLIDLPLLIGLEASLNTLSNRSEICRRLPKTMLTET